MENNAMDLSAWSQGEAMNEDAIKMLDAKGKELQSLLATKDELAKKTRELNDVIDSLQDELIAYLDKYDKDEYQIRGVGKLKITHRTSVKTPKSEEEKKQFLEYVAQNYGSDGYWTYVSINSVSLNSFYKLELEKSQDPSTFKLPGVGEPTVTRTLKIKQ